MEIPTPNVETINPTVLNNIDRAVFRVTRKFKGSDGSIIDLGIQI